MRIGDSNANATITTNGTGDLILSTNDTLANTATMTIGDTTAGNIQIKPALGATVDTVFDQGRIELGINDWDTTIFAKASGAGRNRYLNAGSFSHTGTRTYDLPTATARHYSAVFGLGTTLAGVSNLGNTNSSYRALQAESHLDLAGISATNAGLDQSVANFSGQAVGISAQGFVKNFNATAATSPVVTSMAAFNQIGDNSATFFDLGNITVTNSVNFTGYTAVAAAIGRTTTVTNAMGFVHTGTRVQGGGTKTITNEYAFRVLDNSQATNKYGIVIDNAAYTNTLGGLNIASGAITSSSNGNIELAPDGTGDVYLTTDTVRVGDSNADATITTNGTGDLILNTNSGTSSGSIVIEDGVNGDIKILVDGTGMMDILKEINVTNFPQTPSSGNNNWAGYDSPTYVGTRQLYSNLAQGNITDPTERVRANTRFTVIKHPNDSTTYNDNDYVIQNTDFTVVDINGQNFAQTSRGAGARGEANNCVLINTAGGTKTGTNINGGSAFVEIDSGHGGDLTSANVMGFRSFLSNRADTGEFTRMTNAYGFVAEGIGTGGTGVNGTNRFVTNEFGYFSQGATGTGLVTNYYGFYANTGANATNKYAFYSASDDYLSRLGTVERTKDKVNALTAGATVTVNTDLAPIHTITLNQNTTFSFTNLSTGQAVTLIIRQDATGSRTGTFTGVIFAGGTPALSVTANAIDVVRIVFDGTSNLGIIDKAFA